MELLNNKNFILRLISSLILLPAVFFIVYKGGLLFSLAVIFLSVIMSYEWLSIVYRNNFLKNVFKDKWSVPGIIYIMLFASSVMYLRNLEQGIAHIVIVILLVISSDIGAYFAGNIFGGAKILPSVSPNKTWSGFFGGVTSSAITGLLLSLCFSNSSVISFIFSGVLASFAGHIGDFFESWFKRKFKVKDSSNIIPGHGGVLDRVDALTTVATLFAFLNLLGFSLI